MIGLWMSRAYDRRGRVPKKGGDAGDWLAQAATEGVTYNAQARNAMGGGHRAPEEETAMNRKEMMPAVRERAFSLELPQFHLKIGEKHQRGDQPLPGLHPAAAVRHGRAGRGEG